MRKIFFLSVILFVIACEPDKPEVLDLGEILDESELYPEGQNPEGETELKDTLIGLKKDLKAVGIEVDGISAWDEVLFPERFGPLRTHRFQIASGTDTLRYVSLSFHDSLRVMNSLYNWIDCFGIRCKSVFVGQQSNMQKLPFLLFVGDTSLIYIEANEALVYDHWQGYLESKGFSKNWNLVIEQKKGSKARWFTYQNEKKINWKK